MNREISGAQFFAGICFSVSIMLVIVKIIFHGK